MSNPKPDNTLNFGQVIYPKIITDIYQNIQNVESFCSSSGQIIIIYLHAIRKSVEISSGTFALISSKGKSFILSALHVANMKSEKYYQKCCFLNFSAIDLFLHFNSFVKANSNAFDDLKNHQYDKFLSEFRQTYEPLLKERI